MKQFRVGTFKDDCIAPSSVEPLNAHVQYRIPVVAAALGQRLSVVVETKWPNKKRAKLSSLSFFHFKRESNVQRNVPRLVRLIEIVKLVQCDQMVLSPIASLLAVSFYNCNKSSYRGTVKRTEQPLNSLFRSFTLHTHTAVFKQGKAKQSQLKGNGEIATDKRALGCRRQ